MNPKKTQAFLPQPMATKISGHHIIGLAGNPNVGKSTLFNSLTGLKQHTGNWPGKTVELAYGDYLFQDEWYTLTDLPGTYSLFTNTIDEEVARDFICFEHYDVIVVVVDATSLQRNLNLVLQCLEITNKVVVCVNLMDEAKRKLIAIDTKMLESILQVPIIACSASTQEGLLELQLAIKQQSLALPGKREQPFTVYSELVEQQLQAVQSTLPTTYQQRWIALRLLDGDSSFQTSLYAWLSKDYEAQQKPHNPHLRDEIVTTLIEQSQRIASTVVVQQQDDIHAFDRKLDRYLTSTWLGIPLMLLLLLGVFWLTMYGANYPSQLLAAFLFQIEEYLLRFAEQLQLPSYVSGLFISGMYRTLAWVVSVMLPPMAIFFPLFTLLEDFGYLPRVAFNLDNYFKKANACGKQALSMCMGFGCNAAGVIGCRIIDSPRERLIAILTNNFVPCNGRFPMLIAIISMFFTGYLLAPFDNILAASVLTLTILLGIIMTFLVSKLLSITLLKGIPSSLILELPPYRKPQILKVIVRSMLDRTLFVLARAMMIAAPAGLLIWFFANTSINNISILNHFASALQPFAVLIGLDGFILLAFLLGFPANEIVIPILIMCYLSTGQMSDYQSIQSLKTLLVDHGWTWVTAINVLLFSMMHFPCGTTLLTIKKETQSIKWTLLSFLIPTVAGLTCCFLFTTIVRFFNLG